MALPPLYKYLDGRGAKLTLGNRTFKHAKPSDFNDTEELSIQTIFSEDTEVALERLANGFTDVILRHLNDAPTCGSPMKEKVLLLQRLYRTKPEAAELTKAELAKEGGKGIFDVDSMRTQAEMLINEMNEQLQRYRVLCVTTLKDSEVMWAKYAEDHKGIALRIEPNLAKDSKFQLFRPVTYRKTRPPLYEDTLEFSAGSLFGDKEARIKEMVERIVYSKTLDWAHESEYRLAIPMRQDEKPWDTLSYHPDEITELYLGLAMEQADSEEILRFARAVNPAITVYRAKRDGDERLGFDPI